MHTPQANITPSVIAGRIQKRNVAQIDWGWNERSGQETRTENRSRGIKSCVHRLRESVERCSRCVLAKQSVSQPDEPPCVG